MGDKSPKKQNKKKRAVEKINPAAPNTESAPDRIQSLKPKKKDKGR